MFLGLSCVNFACAAMLVAAGMRAKPLRRPFAFVLAAYYLAVGAVTTSRALDWIGRPTFIVLLGLALVALPVPLWRAITLESRAQVRGRKPPT
jgi:nitric oxide reductase large subunit